MNQRIRPPMPPEGGDRPQRRYHRRWNYWRRYPFYRQYDRYYNWYNRYYDWDYYRSSSPQQAPMPMPEPEPEQAAGDYLKIEPMLLANLLKYANQEVQSDDQLNEIMDRVLELHQRVGYIDDSYFEFITGIIAPTDESPEGE